MCAVIGVGVGVAVAIGYCLVAFRARGKGEPSQATGNRTLEILWTAAPIAIVAGLFVMSVETMGRSDPPADRAPDLVVVGHHVVVGSALPVRCRRGQRDSRSDGTSTPRSARVR